MTTMSPADKARYDAFAATHEDAHLFPGDFITEDYDDDPYGVMCTNCGDHGCEQCDPQDSYDDQDTSVICTDCSRWFELDELTNGLCDECIGYRVEDMHTTCVACHQPHPSILTKRNELCSECEDYYARLDEEYRATTTYCVSCGYYHYEPGKTDEDFCPACEALIQEELEELMWSDFMFGAQWEDPPKTWFHHVAREIRSLIMS